FLPPRPRRRDRKPTVIRNFGNDPAVRGEPEIPPFAGSNPTEGKVTAGFDGLAMPPVRETDVFSQMGSARIDAAFASATGGQPLTPVDLPDENASDKRNARGQRGGDGDQPA